MAILTCNGKPVLVARLNMPRIGAWLADLEISSESEVTGAIQIIDDDLTFAGTVIRSGLFSDRAFIRAVGGAGKLGEVLDAKHYVGAQLSTVLSDLTSATTEVLDSSSQTVFLSTILPYWTRPQATAGTILTRAAEQVGAGWRVLASGKIWVGSDTYPIQRFEHQVLPRDPSLGVAVIASEKLELRPGVTFDGRRVSRVEHMVSSGSVRTTYWYET